MADGKTCDSCGISFDWPGVRDMDRDYCCESCESGDGCTCEIDNPAMDATRFGQLVGVGPQILGDDVESAPRSGAP